MAKILVVDDDVQLRATLRLALALHGHEIVEASHGAEALSLLDIDLPDLIVLDWHMPNMGGLQTCRAIRTRAETLVRKLPLIATSSLNRSEEALGAGATDFLRKPFGIDELIERIARLL